MKTIKRTVAALLATLMLATSTSFTALAAEEYTDAQEVAMAKVNAASIMTGTDKGFEPSKSLTRAEAAAIIVRMKGISKSASDAAAGTTLFNDVAASHWASGYVNQASNLGIVKGVSATEFAPDREVTIAEFTTMAVRALGAGQLVDSEGVWPTNYINFANENDILKDVPGIYTAVAKRVEAATIVANTIEAIMWEKRGVKSNGEISWEKSYTEDTIVDDVLKLDPITNKVVDAVDFYNRKVELNGVTGKISVADDFDLTSIKVGYAYDGYSKDNKILGLWKAKDNKTKTVAFDEIIKNVATKTIKVSVNGSEEEFDYAEADVEYYYNGDKGTSYPTTILNEANVSGTLTMKNNEVVAVYMNEYTNAGVVDEVTAKKVKFDTLSGMDATLNDEDHVLADLVIDEAGIKAGKLSYFVEKDGKEIEVTDIEEGDVVFFYSEKNAGKVFHVSVMSNVVEGKVQSTSTNYVKVDGTKYNYSGTLDVTPTAKDEVKLFLNAAGKVFAYDEVEGSSEFAVLSSLEFIKNQKDEIKAQVVLTFADGSKSEVSELNIKHDEKIATKVEKLNALLDGTEVIFTDGNKLATDKTLKDANDAAKFGATSKLGKVFAYQKDGDKFILKTNTTKIKAEAATTKFVNKTTKYFTQGASTFLVNKNTKVLVVKKDSDKNYKVKVSAVDVDTLETSKDAFKATMIDVKDTGYVSLVVLNEIDSTNKVKKGDLDETWSYVLTRTEDIDNDDYTAEVTILTEAGKIETYYTDLASVTVGAIGYLTIADNEITDFSADTYDKVVATTDKVLYRTSEKDGFFNYIDTSDATEIKSILLGSDVVYVANEDGEYVAGSESDIEDADDSESTVTYDDGTTIIETVLTYTDEDSITEVVGVIYVK